MWRRACGFTTAWRSNTSPGLTLCATVTNRSHTLRSACAHPNVLHIPGAWNERVSEWYRTKKMEPDRTFSVFAPAIETKIEEKYGLDPADVRDMQLAVSRYFPEMVPALMIAQAMHKTDSDAYTTAIMVSMIQAQDVALWTADPARGTLVSRLPLSKKIIFN